MKDWTRDNLAGKKVENYFKKVFQWYCINYPERPLSGEINGFL